MFNYEQVKVVTLTLFSFYLTVYQQYMSFEMYLSQDVQIKININHTFKQAYFRPRANYRLV